MRVLEEILAESKYHGVKASKRVFWKYQKQGLLPGGKRIKGRGNVLYFPDDSVVHLWIVHYLSNQVGLPLAVITKMNLTRFSFTPSAIATPAARRKLERTLTKEWEKLGERWTQHLMSAGGVPKPVRAAKANKSYRERGND